MNINIQAKIGLLFAMTHLIAFWGFILYLMELSSKDGQGALLWVFWLGIDFPVSLLTIIFFALDITSHYMLYLVHGFLGTIWWFYLTKFLFKKLTDYYKNESR